MLGGGGTWHEEQSDKVSENTVVYSMKEWHRGLNAAFITEGKATS